MDMETYKERKKRTERLKNHLKTSTSRHASNLLTRMTRCGSDWNYRFTCRTAGCAHCRGSYLSRQRRAALKRFDGVDRNRLAFGSLVVGATQNLSAVKPMFEVAKKKLRNLVNTRRAKSILWHDFEVLGWLEVDAFHRADLDRLPPEKRTQMEFLLQEQSAMWDEPVWVVTIHAIVGLGGVDLGQARAELEKKWKGPHCVDLQPFYTTRTRDESIKTLVRYSLKHECKTALDGSEFGSIKEEWHGDWMADYYSFLHQWSRGFHSLRISISRKKKNNEHIKESIYSEPMYKKYSISISHM
jgi:hypothetical protein